MTHQESIRGYEDCHPVNQVAKPSAEKLLQQAITFLDLQRNRALYPMDEQIETQKEINEFIERWQCTKSTH